MSKIESLFIMYHYFVYGVRTRLGGIVYRTTHIDSDDDNPCMLHALFCAELYKQGVSVRVITLFSYTNLTPPGTVAGWPGFWTWKTATDGIPILIQEPKWTKVVFRDDKTNDLMQIIVHGHFDASPLKTFSAVRAHLELSGMTFSGWPVLECIRKNGSIEPFVCLQQLRCGFMFMGNANISNELEGVCLYSDN